MALVKYNNNSISAVTSTGLASGALVPIKTLTASSSATLSFVNGSSDVVFDATYPIYKFNFINMHPETADRELVFQGTTNGSNYNIAMTTTYFYAWHSEGGTSYFQYDAARDQAQGTDFQRISLPVRTDNDSSCSGELFIFNPSSTTFVKHFIARTSSYSQDSAEQDVYVAGYFNTTSAITGMQFKQRTGDLGSGKIKLYGIKDS